MGVEEILPGLYVIPLGGVNAFLIDSDGLTLIDTGFPNSPEKILEAVQTIGREAADIKQILVTHCHPDHAGDLAVLKQRTGAPAYMHSADAEVVRVGKMPSRNFKAAPFLINRLLFRFLIGAGDDEIETAEIEHEVQDGDELPIAGGLRAIHAPGHCAGQLAFLWQGHNGVLFTADVASNMMGLGYSIGYEDFEMGKHDLGKIAALDFEVACFGHGKTIMQGASAKFRKKWGA
jgi:glyoxylase-like metal-dependent hydrolase (beta-lactamase superfamily II)